MKIVVESYHDPTAVLGIEELPTSPISLIKHTRTAFMREDFDYLSIKNIQFHYYYKCPTYQIVQVHVPSKTLSERSRTTPPAPATATVHNHLLLTSARLGQKQFFVFLYCCSCLYLAGFSLAWRFSWYSSVFLCLPT